MPIFNYFDLSSSHSPISAFECQELLLESSVALDLEDQVRELGFPTVYEI